MAARSSFDFGLAAYAQDERRERIVRWYGSNDAAHAGPGRVSAVAFDRHAAERGQRAGAFAVGSDGFRHRSAQSLKTGMRGFQSDQRRKRCLVLRLVLAGGLAERGAVALYVEDV